MSDTVCKGRFAPSPSGYMHLGNLLSLLLAYLDIRSLGGRLVFRLEDLDPARSRREYSEALVSDLRWLGLDWDEGYPDPTWAQSARTAFYEDAFSLLQARGLLYPCWCTRAQRLAAANAPHEGEHVSDPGCRCSRMTEAERLAAEVSGRRPAWKLRVPRETITVEDGCFGTFSSSPARDMGDIIVRRTDGVFAYQLAVSVDDMAMGVTRVVRGRDLLLSAPVQKWLIGILGGTAPAYCHAPLLVSADGGGKLSKRAGSLSTAELRGTAEPEEIIGRLAFLCGLAEDPAPVSARSLIPHFDWKLISREDIAV